MRFTSLPSLCVVLLILATSAAGCAERSDTVAVSGHVTYRGEPLTNGAVTFYPVTGRPVSAALSPQGDYGAELPPGDYGVTINVGTELPPGFKEGDLVPPPKIVLPPEYSTMARSKLTATVTADSEEPIDFALK